MGKLSLGKVEWPLELSLHFYSVVKTTPAEGQHGAGIGGGGAGAQCLGKIPRAQSCREQSRGTIAKASWRKQHLITSPPDLESPFQ